MKSLAELSLGVQLLFAIKSAFEANPAKKQWRLEELQQALIADRSSIWGEMPDTGKQVSLPCIASTLKKYGIVRRRPRNGVARNRPRVYLTRSFDKTFDRYLKYAEIADEAAEAETAEAASAEPITETMKVPN